MGSWGKTCGPMTLSSVDKGWMNGVPVLRVELSTIYKDRLIPLFHRANLWQLPVPKRAFELSTVLGLLKNYH